MPLNSVFPQKDIEKTALYPRQKKPEKPEEAPAPAPAAKKSKGFNSGLLNLLKNDAASDAPKVVNGDTALGAIFADARKLSDQPPQKEKKTPPNAADMLSYWQKVTVESKAEKQRLSEQFSNILKRVELDGVKQAGRAKSWPVKLFWFFLVILLTSFLIYEIVKCTNAYYYSPVTTTYKLKTPDAMDFPQIYICYGNTINRTYMLENRDKMLIATTFRDRNAVSAKKSPKRRKRETDSVQHPDVSHDDDSADLFSFNVGDDDAVSRVLAGREVDQDHFPTPPHWMLNPNHPFNQQIDDENAIGDDDQLEDDQDENSDSTLLTRLRRDLNATTITMVGVGNGTKTGNSTSDAQAVANAAAAIAAAAANAARIQSIMRLPNISEIVYEYYQEAAYKVDQTFLECSFQTHEKKKLKCSDIIRPIVDANYGVCYLVTLPDEYKQTMPGRGLSLLMNTHLNLYPKTESEGPPRYAGFMVSIYKQYDPFNWLKSCVLPGRLTKIDLSSTHVHLENLESGALIQPCVDNESGKGKMKVFSGNYSRTMCQMDCLYQAHLANCSCVLLIDKSQIKAELLNSTQFCSPSQFMDCVGPLAGNKEAMKKVNECASACYTPCESYRYEMRSSNARLHPQAYDRLNLPTNVTVQQLVELRVAFGKMEHADLIQKPSASMADLIANLGGQINLWMGASMLTLIQMIAMLTGFAFWHLFMKCHATVQEKKAAPPPANK